MTVFSRLTPFLALFALSAPDAAGHGRALHVTAEGGALVASHPPGEAPFSQRVLWQDEPNSGPDGAAPLPGVGDTLLWSLPGLTLGGFDPSDNLTVRPVAWDDPFTAGDQQRVVWWWDAATERAGPTDLEMRLISVADGALAIESLSPTAGAPPGEFEVAQSLAGELGFHNHDLLRFGVEGADPPEGLYGLFVRFGAEGYTPTEPVLLVLNHGVPIGGVESASEALYGAARPGDYDHNGVVDPADLAVWSGSYGGLVDLAHRGADGNGDGRIDAIDYAVWRDAAAAPPGSFSVPEPSALCLAALAVLPAMRRRIDSRRPDLRRWAAWARS